MSNLEHVVISRLCILAQTEDIKFQRVWDSSCPKVWDRWEANGKTWVIQDIAPEDDDIAVEILINHMCTDETLCAASNVVNDPISMESFRMGWKHVLAQRVSLGCYTEVEGKKTLVALNACIVESKSDEIDPLLQGDAAMNVVGALKYIVSKCCNFDHLNTDQVLTAFGLVVVREYRGHKLGGRLLEARKPLCLAIGVKGSSTVFTGPAAQKLAERAGFTTTLEVTLRELADADFKYPKDDRVLKYMMKKF